MPPCPRDILRPPARYAPRVPAAVRGQVTLLTATPVFFLAARQGGAGMEGSREQVAWGAAMENGGVCCAAPTRSALQKSRVEVSRESR